jgi:hypothetical protein
MALLGPRRTPRMIKKRLLPGDIAKLEFHRQILNEDATFSDVPFNDVPSLWVPKWVTEDKTNKGKVLRTDKLETIPICWTPRSYAQYLLEWAMEIGYAEGLEDLIPQITVFEPTIPFNKSLLRYPKTILIFGDIYDLKNKIVEDLHDKLDENHITIISSLLLLNETGFITAGLPWKDAEFLETDFEYPDHTVTGSVWGVADLLERPTPVIDPDLFIGGDLLVLSIGPVGLDTNIYYTLPYFHYVVEDDPDSGSIREDRGKIWEESITRDVEQLTDEVFSKFRKFKNHVTRIYSGLGATNPEESTAFTRSLYDYIFEQLPEDYYSLYLVLWNGDTDVEDFVIQSALGEIKDTIADFFGFEL